MASFLDAFLHLDVTLGAIIADYGIWTYAILFVVIFVETGIVVAPFLPGDSLLFAAGTFAGMGRLDLLTTLALLATASILGDTANYWIGRRLGALALREGSLFGIRIKRSYLEQTNQFFEKYGTKAIIVGRFLPILRTFAPFVAGVGKMHYPTFFIFNLVGGLAWVTLFVVAGYFFGTIPLVRDNFAFVIVGIIVISLLPTAIEYLRWKRRA
jgi:membrane-associated protein